MLTLTVAATAHTHHRGCQVPGQTTYAHVISLCPLLCEYSHWRDGDMRLRTEQTTHETEAKPRLERLCGTPKPRPLSPDYRHVS